MNVRRFIQAGAVWGWPLFGDPLTEARSRYVVTGNPGIEESPWGKAMSFDGTNDYVTLRDSEEYPLRFNSGAQDFSVVAWVRADEDADATVIDKRDGADDGWMLYTASGGYFGFSIDPSFGYAEAAVGAWHCIAATVDRSTLAQLYVDGIATGVTFNPAGEVMATTTVPRIGAQSFDAAAKLTGAVAGIVIWNRILTAAECAALATPGRAF